MVLLSRPLQGGTLFCASSTALGWTPSVLSAARCLGHAADLHDLLFAHWPVAADQMRPLVPAQLELDRFGGECWIGVIPFRMSRIQARGLPPLPGLSAFPELNVRTYVTYGGWRHSLFIAACCWFGRVPRIVPSDF